MLRGRAGGTVDVCFKTMGQDSDPSSSSRSRKRKFDEFDELTGKRLEPNSGSENPDPNDFTTSDAISYCFQFAYQEQITLDQGSMQSLMDSSKTPLEKLQGASRFGCEHHDYEAFSVDNPVWVLSTETVAEAMVDLVNSLGSFHQSRRVAAGTVTVSPVWNQGDGSKPRPKLLHQTHGFGFNG
jgi:hypothetical protein